MITFTGFVFSILLLAVQFGSNQFSPRILRRFPRDPTTKIALGAFMATYLYALLVLRVAGAASEQSFVPSNSISVALLPLPLSMIMFLRLIDETRQFGEGSVQATRRLRALLGDLREVVPEPRRAAVTAELELLDASTDRADRISVATPDRQGLGAADRPIAAG